ncbi:FAD-dependent oxidoreductase [Evansella cellulosilytica]|uniref:FAD-dependent pyridine nucleotide-disulfide oxidoreductase n=1 Tax=Evansella cellulosilytica (strain ATCC 21833 / DSM 2522 / FERM P-1141 / JCM 9156 / N-4) TaxID=649639 RepID=E6TXD0_EVAC2|nr:FAD-dependent oxidoreductase [Evansella cellulosilytica]ADU32325.1 FAD-dependent pyridine nucleotide-disulfide oxidoreductase [Evansella cellulosilytica DSM 2522]
MNVVIIGGDAAGMSAAMQVVRNDENASVTVFEKGEFYSYAQCGLPYYIGGHIDDRDRLIARHRDTFEEKYGIDARILHEVTRIDPTNQLVIGTDLESGDTFEQHYDKCLIATGASPIIPPWDGRDLAGIHVLKTIPDADDILTDMKEDVLTVTVIGGGYIGLEVAENLVEHGKKVRIIDQADRLGMVYDEELSELLQEEAESHGVEVILGESVKHFNGSGRVREVVTNKGKYATDMVIVAVGVKPNSQFAKEAGIHLHPSGAIVVNPYMETNVKNIYAAGDCATQFHRIKQLDDYIPLGTHANKQGRVAGSNIAGVTATFQGVVGTSIMKFFRLTVGRTGLSVAEAEALRIHAEPLKFRARSHASYYPDSEKILIKLLRDSATDKLLGVQAIGKKGVDKRIDVAATALYHDMTIADMENLDLSYAPPFNSVWDPLQQAARRY